MRPSIALTKTCRRRRPLVESLEDRLAPAGLLNGDFSIGDPTNPDYGWTTRGGATIADGQGILAEGTTVQSDLSQSFTIPAGTTALRFTIVASDLVDNGADNPPDAFEAALLDSTTQAPLVGPPANLTGTDAFLNIQQTGQVYYASQVTVPGVGASGDVASLSFPEIVTVDLSAVPADTPATLYFDLIGFSPATSEVRVDDVSTFSGAVPPPVSFTLDPATDSGVLGDGLTNFNPVNLLGATDPDQIVLLAIGTDGFTDGTTTSDANGHFSFTGVHLAEGVNTVRVEATNVSGTTVATQTITVDTQIPTGSLVSPSPGSTVTIDPGYVDVQWTAPGLAPIDTSTFDTKDVTVTGVTVLSVEDLGGDLERYHYAAPGVVLSTNAVNVTLEAGQVADLAGNTNAQSVQSFIYQPIQTQPDSYTVNQDATLTVSAASGVLINDSTTDDRILTAAVVAQPTHGKLVLSANGSFVYTPTAGYSGPDGFTYQAVDGSLVSATTAVTIQVNPTLHAPVAANDSYTTPFNTKLTEASPGVLANDTDSANLPLTASLATQALHGAVTLNSNGSFTYVPTSGYSGADSFTYVANNGLENSNVATVSITVQPAVVVIPPPVAVNHAYTTAADTPLTVPAPGVLADDTAASHKPLTATLEGGPSHGTLSLDPDGSFTYTPSAGFSGVDTFTYEANDSLANSNVATVTITVSPAVIVVNPPPVAANDSYTTAEGTILTIAAPGVLANDTDPPNAPLSAVLVSSTTNGTLNLAADGSFTYSPNAGFSGIDSFVYLANDGTNQSNHATVTITVTATVTITTPPPAPVAVNHSYSAIAGHSLTVAAPGVLAGDTAVSGKPLTATLATPPTHGTIVLNADGSFVYTPDAGFAGADSFRYTASDGTSTSTPASVRVTVAPNHPISILPDTPYFNFLRHRRDRDPANFDRYHPQIGALLALEALGIPTTPTQLLPDSPKYNAFRAQSQANPSGFDDTHPVVGAIFQLESIQGTPTSADLLPDTPKVAALLAQRAKDPTKFDAQQTYYAAIIALEAYLAEILR